MSEETMKSLDDIMQDIDCDILVVQQRHDWAHGQPRAEMIENIRETLEAELEQLIKDECNKLLDRIEESQPSKVKLSTSAYQNEGDGYASERIGYKHGFNDCLEEQRKILADMREGL